jgi:glycosyltransferase involved in cell wall biosynthesis
MSERKRADVEGLSCNGNFFWTRQSAKVASPASSQQPGQGLRRRPMRVTMLLQGSWQNDARVIREADTLAQNGFEVCVIHRIEGEKKTERRGQVIYHGIPRSAGYGVRACFAVFRLHLQVMWRDLRRISQSLSADWIRACAEYTVLSLLGCVLVVLLPVLALILAAARIIARPLRSLWQLKGTDEESSRSLPRRLVMWVVSLCRRELAYLLQPLTHLDDFAYACGDAIMLTGPDVIHAHDLVTLSAGALVSERLGCRLIYDAHELETKKNYWSLNAWTRYWITRYEATLARSADRVVTVCDSIADYLAQAYDIKRPVVVMNSPKMDGTAVRMSETLRSTLKLSTGIPIVVYVGSVTINRGLEHCVKALTYLPDVHFATVGPRYSVIEQRLVEIADSLGVRNRLHFVDPVPTEQVVSFVRDADCSVMAIQNVCLSYYFCFPNKLLESVLAGLPVVVADLLEMRRFVEQYNVGVIMNEKDPMSIAHAIRMVLDNSSRYRPTPEKIQNITATYGWAVQQERMLQLYGDLTVSS